jgi:hypothetical protein
MKGQYKYFRNSKPIVEVAIVGFVLVTLSCKLDVTAQGCSLFYRAAWVALEVLRPVILAAWQSAPACLCEDSRFLQHLLQIGASIWPLVCVMAG